MAPSLQSVGFSQRELEAIERDNALEILQKHRTT